MDEYLWDVRKIVLNVVWRCVEKSFLSMLNANLTENWIIKAAKTLINFNFLLLFIKNSQINF